ncbi:hypothetical protein, partial [Janthinobacterium sp. HH103]|uniref:hypothetical protein n=1 Tax=Janthinobacterium sp. HH103 TaxID=1537275 RepID=UPI001C2F9286
DDEDAEMLAEQIGLNAAAPVAEASAAPTHDEPVSQATTSTPRARKSKAAAPQKPWPWPKSPVVGTTKPTPDTEATTQ